MCSTAPKRVSGHWSCDCCKPIITSTAWTKSEWNHFQTFLLQPNHEITSDETSRQNKSHDVVLIWAWTAHGHIIAAYSDYSLSPAHLITFLQVLVSSKVKEVFHRTSRVPPVMTLWLWSQALVPVSLDVWKQFTWKCHTLEMVNIIVLVTVIPDQLWCLAFVLSCTICQAH